jgi:hypothetical protein
VNYRSFHGEIKGFFEVFHERMKLQFAGVGIFGRGYLRVSSHTLGRWDSWATKAEQLVRKINMIAPCIPITTKIVLSQTV